MVRRLLVLLSLALSFGGARAQINAEKVLIIGRNALYYEDYVLSIQYFNQVIGVKPWLYEPYFFRGLAKYYLDDYIGGEQDCSEAIERSPFNPDAYQVRGLCRIMRNDFVGAAADYREAISIEPEKRELHQNLALCLIENKEYEEADKALDLMIRKWPKYGKSYAFKAQIALEQKDTARAVRDLDRSLEISPNDGDGWATRAIISLQQEKYAEGEKQLDKAISLLPRVAGNYVNRAMARFNLENLRGAMDDYDRAVTLDANNYLAHFNRALLRSQVGDDNRAIEDFDFVLEREPDNYIALFNRALLYGNVGNYKAAVEDINRVLKEYPEFWTGYRYRAQMRRKMGDVKGAERDEFKVFKAEMDRRNGVKTATRKKMRKQSERDINDYDKLVMADKTEAGKHYDSDYRGRVQDRPASIDMEPDYVLSYYKHSSEVQRFVAFYNGVEALNQSHVLPNRIYLTTKEGALDQHDVDQHFLSIQRQTEALERHPNDSLNRYLVRAVDYLMVHDFDAAISDLNRLSEMGQYQPVISFLKSAAKKKLAEAGRVRATETETGLLNRLALDDLQQAVRLAPDFAFAYYNLGNAYARNKEYNQAVEAYGQAIGLDEQLAEAWYNRGLVLLELDRRDEAVKNLSKAGEMGLYKAYSILKQETKKLSTTP